MMDIMQCQVTAVVVSYNREQLLQECLDGLYAQTRRPDHVIVVDNASTDHAVQVAKNHPIHAQVVCLRRNVGGAGGFCAGIAEAVAPIMADYTPSGLNMTDEAHYVWLMDDDTIPLPSALEELLVAVNDSIRANGMLPTVLGSKALWTNGQEHRMNKPRPRTFVQKGEPTLFGDDGTFQARSMSFVSCLINAGAIIGLARLPRAAYFLWNDDFEFTTALLKTGLGYYVPNSVVMHKTKVFGSSDADPGARFYNEVRNKIWMLRFSRDIFQPAELGEFILKTVRRWSLTMMRAHDRSQIKDCFRRGWHDGWHTDPPTNRQIFSDNPTIYAAVRRIEG